MKSKKIYLFLTSLILSFSFVFPMVQKDLINQKKIKTDSSIMINEELEIYIKDIDELIKKIKNGKNLEEAIGKLTEGINFIKGILSKNCSNTTFLDEILNNFKKFFHLICSLSYIISLNGRSEDVYPILFNFDSDWNYNFKILTRNRKLRRILKKNLSFILSEVLKLKKSNENKERDRQSITKFKGFKFIDVYNYNATVAFRQISNASALGFHNIFFDVEYTGHPPFAIKGLRSSYYKDPKLLDSVLRKGYRYGSILQIGIVLANSELEPFTDELGFVRVYQFNLKEPDPDLEQYSNPESIKLLTESGIDLDKINNLGIDANLFLVAMRQNGLLSSPLQYFSERDKEPLWIGWGVSGDLAYMIGMLERNSNPSSLFKFNSGFENRETLLTRRALDLGVGKIWPNDGRKLSDEKSLTGAQINKYRSRLKSKFEKKMSSDKNYKKRTLNKVEEILFPGEYLEKTPWGYSAKKGYQERSLNEASKYLFWHFLDLQYAMGSMLNLDRTYHNICDFVELPDLPEIKGSQHNAGVDAAMVFKILSTIRLIDMRRNLLDEIEIDKLNYLKLIDKKNYNHISGIDVQN